MIKYMGLRARLSTLLVACVLACGCGTSPANSAAAAPAAPRAITVLSFGGSFADAQRKAYYAPFAQANGIEVREASYNGEYGKLKAMVESNAVTADVADIESAALIRGTREGLFLPIDYKIVNKDSMIPQAVDDHAIGADLYSVSLGYNTKRFQTGGAHPQDWKDFWDTRKFPGPRAMKRDPKFTLEIALMADGVPSTDLYKTGGLDLDRAFRSLDKIKSSVTLWWTTGAQPIQALGSGEVVMAAAFGARMFTAKEQDKQPIDLTWSQGIIDVEYWAVLKGAPAPQVSMQFISFASLPKQQAAFSTAFPLGPANAAAIALLDPSLAAKLNTHPDNLKNQVFLNAKWWADNETAVSERFNTWLAKK